MAQYDQCPENHHTNRNTFSGVVELDRDTSCTKPQNGTFCCPDGAPWVCEVVFGMLSGRDQCPTGSTGILLNSHVLELPFGVVFEKSLICCLEAQMIQSVDQ